MYLLTYVRKPACLVLGRVSKLQYPQFYSVDKIVVLTILQLLNNNFNLSHRPYVIEESQGDSLRLVSKTFEVAGNVLMCASTWRLL